MPAFNPTRSASASRTASDLKGKIEHALIRSAEADAQRITVDVQGSKVILKGTARSWAARSPEASRQSDTTLGSSGHR
jgi:osmotically-inducible protein OsmY